MSNTILKTLTSGIIALSLSLAACSKQEITDTTDKKDIKIGTTVGDFGDMVTDSIKPILEAKGYQVQLIEFTDYVRPNLALAEGGIDANVFQHIPYLDNFKKEHNLDITPVFQVPTASLGIYPGKLKNLEDIKDGDTISAPNDPSNYARALVMLNELGWITLKDDVNPLTASKNDILSNPKNIKIIELEAAQLPRSRDDVDFAIINGNYAMSSGIPLTDALYLEPSFAYVNWGTVRTQDIDTPWVKDIIAAYDSDEFKTYSREKYQGYKFPDTWK